MRNIMLNAGGMGANPDGIGAMSDHFAGCRRIALIDYAWIDEPTGALVLMQKMFPKLNFASRGVDQRARCAGDLRRHHGLGR